MENLIFMYAGFWCDPVKSKSGEEVREIIVAEDNGRGFDPSDESIPHTTLENSSQRLNMI